MIISSQILIYIIIYVILSTFNLYTLQLLNMLCNITFSMIMWSFSHGRGCHTLPAPGQSAEIASPMLPAKVVEIKESEKSLVFLSKSMGCWEDFIVSIWSFKNSAWSPPRTGNSSCIEVGNVRRGKTGRVLIGMFNVSRGTECPVLGRSGELWCEPKPWLGRKDCVK